MRTTSTSCGSMVQAHAYWRLKGLAVDLVIWNEDRGGYRQVLQDQIIGLIAAGIEAHVDRPAGRHLRAPRRADRRRGPHPAAVGGARDHHRPPRQPGRAGRAPRPGGSCALPRTRADARATRRGGGHRGQPARDADPRSTAWAASRPTAASTSITHAAGPDDARAVGQRARQSRVRHGGLRERRARTRGARTRTSSG